MLSPVAIKNGVCPHSGCSSALLILVNVYLNMTFLNKHSKIAWTGKIIIKKRKSPSAIQCGACLFFFCVGGGGV